jgi:hypothetical protein
MKKLVTIAAGGLLLAGSMLALGFVYQPSESGVGRQDVYVSVPAQAVHFESLPAQHETPVAVSCAPLSPTPISTPIMMVWREKAASGKWVVKSCPVSESGAKIGPVEVIESTL